MGVDKLWCSVDLLLLVALLQWIFAGARSHCDVKYFFSPTTYVCISTSMHAYSTPRDIHIRLALELDVFCCGQVTGDILHIHRDYFFGTWLIIWLPKCRWSNIVKCIRRIHQKSQYNHNKIKHSTVCIVCGIFLFESVKGSWTCLCRPSQLSLCI